LYFNNLQKLSEIKPEYPCETQENKGAGLKMCISFSCQDPFQQSPICFFYRSAPSPTENEIDFLRHGSLLSGWPGLGFLTH